MNRPFDAKRYKRLLEGLDVSVISRSQLLARNSVQRIDAEYFSRDNLRALQTLLSKPHDRLDSVAFITDGIHASIEFADGSGVRVLSAMHPKQNYLDLTQVDEISIQQHAANPRTSLKLGDVLISTVGTIGNASVVTAEALPANSDRHVGIIRCKPSLPPEVLSTFLVSRYGRVQSVREATGNVQLNLFISKLREIIVPRVSREFANRIAKHVKSAHAQRAAAATLLTQAETALTTALGLADWQPPRSLSYSQRASKAFTAGRLDAEYFAPRVSELLTRLRADGRTIADVAPARRLRFVPSGAGEFRYIEIGNVGSDGTANVELVAMSEAPSRATQLVRASDVLTSTVRPVRRLSAIVLPEQDGAVASSGFVVLQPRAVAAEVLLTYLRLPLVCEVMDLHTSASLYPAISESDLLSLPFPAIGQADSETIAKCVQEAHASRRRARELLAAAQRAVEIAIEQDEAAALVYLEGFGVNA